MADGSDFSVSSRTDVVDVKEKRILDSYRKSHNGALARREMMRGEFRKDHPRE